MGSRAQEASDRNLQFFLPHGASADPLPQRPEDYWAWICRNRSLGEGRYSWTLQTFLQLQAAGLPVSLHTRFPARGIVVSHRDFLPLILPPRTDVFLVCIKPDRKEHTWSHFYVVQNDSDVVFQGVGKGCTEVLPFWPQPSLLPRDPARGTRCENVAYLGRLMNLAVALQTAQWSESLRQSGLHWMIVPLERWHDYSQTDVVVAVREFGAAADPANPVLDPNSKPPSKLINAWLAGVPAVLGEESSFRSIRRSPLDYLEVGSVAQLRETLLRLQREPSLYQDMVAHGRERAREFSAQAVSARWRDMAEKRVFPAYDAWMQRSSPARLLRNVGRVASYFASWRKLAGLRISQKLP
jgi:hypothetical protein